MRSLKSIRLSKPDQLNKWTDGMRLRLRYVKQSLIEWPCMLTTVRQLRSTFWDIFECEGGEIRLALAKKMLTAYHYQRRFASKRQLELAEREKCRATLAKVHPTLG